MPFSFPLREVEEMEMTFDAGTWWLVTIIVTVVVGVIGFLFGRSVFKALDENRSDIKEVRENYTPRKDHQKDVETLRREMKEMRAEQRDENKKVSDDIDDIKENCFRKDDALREFAAIQSTLREMQKYLMGGGRNA